MARTTKSKDAQRAHRRKFWLKAYGYDYTYAEDLFGVIPDELWTTNRYGGYVARPTDKRKLFEDRRWYTTDRMSFQDRKTGLYVVDRRHVNKQFRSKARNLIHNYLCGKAEDVLIAAAGPKNPCWYW